MRLTRPSLLSQVLLDSAWLSLGYVRFSRLPFGIHFEGEVHAADATFFYDLAYRDDEDRRQLSQRIFDEVFELVSNATRLLVIDQFLFHDYPAASDEPGRPLARQLTDAIVARRHECPDLQVYFITDPVSTIYGGAGNPYLDELRDAGVIVAITDLDQLRDSNPLYSFLWRLLVRPFGNRPGGWVRNPLNDDLVTLRSYLTMLNMKANHRKSVIADDGAGEWVGFVATANPHDASSAHGNVALRFTGPAVADLYATECAVLKMSRIELPEISVQPASPASSLTTVQVVTERYIKLALLDTIDSAVGGDDLSLVLLYLSDHDVVSALNAASDRGVNVRLILDTNQDAFGMRKVGIPNQPVATDLVTRGVRIRWAYTRGEQCHSKMLLHRHARDITLILGSANFTRRNLDNFNLETDVVVRGTSDAPALAIATRVFERLWHNEEGKTYTLDYEVYGGRKPWRYALYWFMEKTGISTF